MLKDKINDRVRHRQSLSDEVITRVNFIDTLEKKDKEIAVLRQEITTLKQELLTVKSRNKKLCNILGQGESEFILLLLFVDNISFKNVKLVVALTINTRLTGIKNLLYFTVKDKAEVLIEVERLRAVQAELTSELAALHTDLEKERSKNAQDPRTKDKVKYIFIMKFVA